MKWVDNWKPEREDNFVEPAVCFSDLKAYEELSHSFIKQKPNNITLRQQTFIFLIFMNHKFQCIIFPLASDVLLSDLQV